MPDITLSFTDAQWARMEAAGINLTGIGTVTEDNTFESLLTANLNRIIKKKVESFEKASASVDSF
tara:strand:+ start:313 stop:507 length:195 start_codon:yes stop_codon:yes gene_type:complete